MTDSRPRPPVTLTAHVLLVASVFTVFVGMVVLTPDDAGANIGAGLVGLVVLGLGLPWCIPLMHWWTFDGGVVGYYLLLLTPALINIGLHVLAWRLLRRRSLRAGAR